MLTETKTIFVGEVSKYDDVMLASSDLAPKHVVTPVDEIGDGVLDDGYDLDSNDDIQVQGHPCPYCSMEMQIR